MPSGAKDKGRESATAVDYVKTQQKVGASLDEKAAHAKAEQAAGRAPEAAGDPKHDSPKRQGDKLEHARDAAAGRTENK